jgi:hypothetical protein
MGYSHYHRQTKNFTKAEWTGIRADVVAILETANAAGIKIGDWAGEKPAKPADCVDSDVVSFNGVGKESCETFVLNRVKSPSDWFTKTQERPYDSAVTAALCYVESLYPAKLTCTSDGDAAEWQAGLDLARKALPHLADRLNLPKGIGA